MKNTRWCRRRYSATATYQGHTDSEQFTVGASGERVAYFRWPAAVE